WATGACVEQPSGRRPEAQSGLRERGRRRAVIGSSAGRRWNGRRGVGRRRRRGRAVRLVGAGERGGSGHHMADHPAQPDGRHAADRVLRVLVAEDEALIRLDLVEMLREVGYELAGEAADGQRAVDLAAELEPDLVIMDVKMPRGDGIDAASEIASRRIAPVVILTAFSQRELVERARDAGAMAYLVKPFSKTDLAPAIEMATSRYAELAALETEVSSLQERLETRKLVEQAKGLLQSRHGMSESEAFRWVQKNSMDRRLTMRKVAETVVETLGGQQS